MKRLYLSLPAALLAGGAAILALSSPLPESSEQPQALIPATPAPVNLACGPEYVPTMGETTAGIEQDETAPISTSSAYILSGGSALLNGNPVEDVWAGENLQAITVDTGDEPGAAIGLTERIQERGELAGFALTPCVTPSSSAMLVGGSTGLSSSAELVLSSISSTPSQVTIEVFTSSGKAPATPISTQTVAGNSTERVLIEAGVLDDRVAVRVSAAGGRVAARLYTHTVDGLVGVGTSTISPGAEPGTTQVIPAVNFRREPTLRVVAPGDEGATFTAHRASDNSVIPGLENVTVAPGSVLDLSLGGLGDDRDGIIVTADKPVAAAVLTSTGDDRGWLGAAEETTRAAAIIPQGTSALQIVSTDSVVTATFYSADREMIDQIDSEGTASAIDVPSGARYVTLQSESVFYGGMWVFRSEGEMSGIEGLPLTLPPAGSADMLATISN